LRFVQICIRINVRGNGEIILELMNYTTKQGKQLIKYMSYFARDVLEK
jgi:hypothetical protein